MSTWSDSYGISLFFHRFYLFTYTKKNMYGGVRTNKMNKKPERVNIPAPTTSPSDRKIHQQNESVRKILRRLKEKRWIFGK